MKGKEMITRELYRETGNIYSVAAEVRRKKKEKRCKIILWGLSIATVGVLTYALHAFNVWRNGYDGIGSECLIPVLAVVIYMVYKAVQDDKRKRQARREYLERKAREAMLSEFKEYDRVRGYKPEEMRNDCTRVKAN